MSKSISYRPAQIWLHWIVVLGVIVQIAAHEHIVSVMTARAHNAAPPEDDMKFAWLHVSVGIIVFTAVLARLYLRFRYGAPGHAIGTSPIQAFLATIMHWALYGALLAMFVTGMLTWNSVLPLGGVHFAINIVMVIAAIAHGLAAIFNQFIRKDGTLARMIPALARK